MRIILPVIVLLIAISSCSKTSNNPLNIDHCSNLINDTTINDSINVQIPNYYSPNNDGINDAWEIQTNYITNLTYVIYDENNKIVDSATVFPNALHTHITYTPTSVGDSSYVHDYYTIEALTFTGKILGRCGDLYILLKTCRPKDLDINVILMGTSPQIYADDPVLRATICN